MSDVHKVSRMHGASKDTVCAIEGLLEECPSRSELITTEHDDGTFLICVVWYKPEVLDGQ